MADTMLDLIEAIEEREAYEPAVHIRDEPTYAVNLTYGRSRRSRAADVRQRDQYRRAVRETMRLIDRVRSGALPDLWLREAMSTSDFSLLFGDVIDRQMLGTYAETPPTYRQIMRMGTVRDFRTNRRFVMDGAENALDEVKELAEYKASKLTPTKYDITIKKYGRRMPFSFETMINDDLAAITDTPSRFSRASRRSEQRFATGIYVSSTGPNSTIYSAGNKNQVLIANGATVDNPKLSTQGLADGLNVLALMKDTDGEPITVEAAILEVPTTLEITAQMILSATNLIFGADSAAMRMETLNFLRNRVSLVVNPYLNLINTTNGATAWYLHAASSTGRPAFEFDFLRGYEAPQLFMKSPNAVRVGGGLVDPMQGSFEDDSLDYKIRHIFGGGALDPKATVASLGTT